MSAMLELRGVIAGYGAGDVLQGVDLDTERGSVTCVVGPNGAGKSTVLRAVSGLLRPREGTIAFEGHDLRGASPPEILGLGISQVPQSEGLFPNLSVRENVLMGAYILRGDRDLVHRRLAEIEEMFPIVAKRGHEHAGNLSGGQRRSVEFARLLMLDPGLVLLDEPSAGLDPKSLKTVAQTIVRMAEAGKTLLIVEQNVRFGLRLASHGVVMESGRVLMHDNADAVLNNPEMTDLFFGGTPTSAPRQAAAKA
jgi:ABC-type branched-subunit amino acid transport system ATPase component